jgi:hypothetical protein
MNGSLKIPASLAQVESDWVRDEIEKCTQSDGCVAIDMLGWVILRRYFPEALFSNSGMRDRRHKHEGFA